MIVRKLLFTALCVLLGLAAMSCNSCEPESNVEVPTPSMPANWQVTDNYVAGPQERSSIASQMSANLVGLRNTVFNVGGRRVQINTIVAASPADARNVMRHLRTIKSDEAILQRGNTIYEFVGPNNVMDSIRAGRQHLAR